MLKKGEVELLETWKMERFLKEKNVANEIDRDDEKGSESHAVSFS